MIKGKKKITKNKDYRRDITDNKRDYERDITKTRTIGGTSPKIYQGYKRDSHLHVPHKISPKWSGFRAKTKTSLCTDTNAQSYNNKKCIFNKKSYLHAEYGNISSDIFF